MADDTLSLLDHLVARPGAGGRFIPSAGRIADTLRCWTTPSGSVPPRSWAAPTDPPHGRSPSRRSSGTSPAWTTTSTAAVLRHRDDALPADVRPPGLRGGEHLAVADGRRAGVAQPRAPRPVRGGAGLVDRSHPHHPVARGARALPRAGVQHDTDSPPRYAARPPGRSRLRVPRGCLPATSGSSPMPTRSPASSSSSSTGPRTGSRGRAWVLPVDGRGRPTRPGGRSQPVGEGAPRHDDQVFGAGPASAARTSRPPMPRPAHSSGTRVWTSTSRSPAMW